MKVVKGSCAEESCSRFVGIVLEEELDNIVEVEAGESVEYMSS